MQGRVALILLTLALLPASALADTGFYPQTFADFQQQWGGSIPFPPDRLRDSLLELDRASTIDAAILPHGRSLERSVTDLRQPRTVMAWKSSQSSTPYYLFLGYTPAKAELEVISWNWKTRRFDFSLVLDYAAGKKPRLVSADKFGCVACHQSRVPIFSESPWSESTFNPFVMAQIKAETVDPFARSWFRSGRRQSLSSPDFDLDVLGAGALAQIQGFCRDACGGDLACRRQVLETALIETQREGSAYDYFTAAELAERVSVMRRQWPADFFKVMSSEIPDRELGADGQARAITVDEDPLRVRRSSQGIAPEGAVEYLFFRRYRGCWSFTAEQRSQIKDMGRRQVRQAMQSAQMNELVRTWPPEEQGILLALSSAAAAPRPLTGPSDVAWVAPKPESRVISDSQRPAKTTLALFRSYCASCHGGAATAQPPGLPLNDLRMLGSYIGTAGRTVREMLDPEAPLMPPMDSPQPSRKELEQMSDAL